MRNSNTKKIIILFFSIFIPAILFAQEQTTFPFSLESLEQAMMDESSNTLDKYVYLLHDIDGDGRKELFVKEKVKEYNTYYGFLINNEKEVELVISRTSGGYEDFGFTADGFLWHYEEHTGGLSQSTAYYKLKNSKVVSDTHQNIEMPSDDGTGDNLDDTEVSFQTYINGEFLSDKESDYKKYSPNGQQTSLYNLEDWKEFPASALAELAKTRATRPIIRSYYGDLNQDGNDDRVVIETPRDKAKMQIREDGYEYNFNQPILYIYFSNGNKYQLFKKYTNVIPHPESDTESVDLEVSITNKGVLRIAYSLFMTMGGCGTTKHSYLYRYQDGDFCLIGEDSEEGARNTGDYENVSINYLTNKKKTTNGNNFNNKKPIEKWFTLPTQPLHKLGEKNLRE